MTRLGLAVMCIVCALAQAPADKTPTIKTNVRQVLVPVVVTDKAGHYVTDLTRDDFAVLEDGTPQKIVAFNRSPVSSGTIETGQTQSPQPRAALPKPAPNESPKRTYLICLDTLHSAFANFTQARKALEKFFEQEEAGDSQYALIALGREPQVLIDSTREPSTILAKLESKDFANIIRETEAGNLASDGEQFLRLMGLYCANCACGVNDKDGPACPVYKGQLKSALLSATERTLFQDKTFLEQLARLVEAISTMPTRRTVLFLSDGFNRFAGDEFYAIVRGYEPRDQTLKFNPRDLQPQLESVLKVAVQYNVRFYTLDSRGLYTAADVVGNGTGANSGGAPESVAHQTMSTAWSNGDAMSELARETGGQFFENSNDLLKGIRRAFADGREEYVIAYAPNNATQDGSFRRISVELKNKKLRVSAKAGYWAFP